MLAAFLFPAAMVAQVSFGKATLWMDQWEQLQKEQNTHETSYRKIFKMSDLRKAETYHLYLDGFAGGVNAKLQVKLNGHVLGNRQNGFVSFIYEMTPYLNKEQDNELVLTLHGVNNAEFKHDIYLITAPKTHLTKWGIEYQYIPQGECNASIDVVTSTTWIHDAGYSLTAQLTDKDCKEVYAVSDELPLKVDADSTHHLCIRLTDVKHWSPQNPNLYLLTVMLHKDGKVVCKGKVKVGLRTLTDVKKKELTLNGETLKLKKYKLTTEYFTQKGDIRHFMQSLKQKGYNAIVLCQPQVQAFYEVADELGLFIFEGRKGKWQPNEVNDIYLRDRIHPSIIFS